MKSRFLIAAAPPAVFLLDRMTKWWIEHSFTFWDTYSVVPGFFSIVHAQNPGAAFSILADAPKEWRVALLIGLSALVTIVVGVMLWNALRGAGQHWSVKLGLALVLGGALGNLYDRVLRGSVTDFLLFYYRDYQFPAFNVADSAISVGAGLLFLDLWRTRRSQATI